MAQIGALFMMFVLVLAAVVNTLVDCAPASVPVEPDPDESSSSSSSSSLRTVSSASAAAAVDDLLRLFNVSRQDLEASRQQLAGNHHHQQQPFANRQPSTAGQQQHFHPDSPSAVSTAQQAMRNRSTNSNHTVMNKSSSAAIQRKQEVYRQVMGFVSQNGRPAPSPAVSAAGPFAALLPPFVQQQHQRAGSVLDAPELYTQTNVGRVRYIQPSCDSPKHTDDELWSASSATSSTTTSSSMHLFFNLSGVQLQTRHGHQLYVIGAKLRLFKFAEGDAEVASGDVVASKQDWPLKLSAEQDDAAGPAAVQTLQTRPVFEPLVPADDDEEKVRVSVHNYTRALKRHRAHKKKLLDSQMALAKEEGYLELDVKLAARWWLAPNGRNFGLSLEVEDTDGQRKPAAHFFRPRNCSIESVDELSDVRDVVSPVLELTVVEVPEGRHIVELPASSKTRSDEVADSAANEESEQAADQLDDEAPLRNNNNNKHRVHRLLNEEQADEAARFYNHQHQHRPQASATIGKHRSVHQQQQRNRSPALAPIPTLATLEDHDLFKETGDSDSDAGAAEQVPDDVRMMRKPAAANLFIQRMLQHQQQHLRHSQQRHTAKVE